MLTKVEVPGLTLRSVLVHGEVTGQLCAAVQGGELFLVVLVQVRPNFDGQEYELASML